MNMLTIQYKHINNINQHQPNLSKSTRPSKVINYDMPTKIVEYIHRIGRSPAVAKSSAETIFKHMSTICQT